MTQHPDLAAGRWYSLTLAQQLGNIGSEIGRAINSSTIEDKTAASYRALELLELTLADSRWYGRGSELARAREVVSEFLFGSNIYKATSASLESYFMQFALYARISR